MYRDNNRLCELLQAKDPLIYVVTHEEQSVIDGVYELLYNCKVSGIYPKDVYVYSFATGLANLKRDNFGQYLTDEIIPEVRSPLDVLNLIDSVQCQKGNRVLKPQGTPVFILKDFYLLFKDPTIVRKLRDIKENYSSKIYCPIIITGPELVLPASISKLFTVYELPLLKSEEIFFKFSPLLAHAELSKNELEAIAKACRGLTEREILRAILHSFAKHDKTDVDPVDIYNEKIAILKVGGMVDFILPSKGMDDLGGCQVFKEWIYRLKMIYSDRARMYGVARPKGALLVGVPGTSKSISAEIIADYLQVPLISLNMSRIMGSLVGESEKNIARALNIANSVSPCVLLIDEVEKLLGGINSSNSCDGGALARVMAQLLQFLQREDQEVITIMTSNDVSQLPPELTRSGRLDGVWFFDFPDREERKQILDIYLNKYGLESDDELMSYMLDITDNYTGAELEQIIKNLKTELYVRQVEERKEVLENRFCVRDVKVAINYVVPIFKANGERLSDFRRDAANKYLKVAKDNSASRVYNRQALLKPAPLNAKKGMNTNV